TAELKDGLLHIHLVREIPEAMKPQKIEINSAGQLLDINKRKKAS
ncbi:MAG: heat-shock protein, partial [Candidatus Puniceispirillaceae bacterium]